MEVFGGFMVMASILGFFLTVIWFILPFVIFAIKGKVDHAEEQLQGVERRLIAIEAQLNLLARQQSAPLPPPVPPHPASDQAVSPAQE